MQNCIGHSQTENFRRFCDKLPRDVQKRVPQKFALLQQDPGHPSLCLKKVGVFWSMRISKECRALAVENQGILVWQWIGGHDEYKRRIR